jgi:SNF2 family DNA or RNA helicase
MSLKSTRSRRAKPVAAATIAEVPSNLPPVDLTWLRQQSDAPLEVPGLQVTPRGYQRVGAAGLICTPQMVLADDPGLGKTGTALMALRWLKEAGLVSRTLLVCPSKLMYQWVSEAEKWLGNDLRCLVIEGTPAQRSRMYDLLEKNDGHPLQHVDLVILNYPIMRIDADRLVTMRFDQFMADEASALKNHTAAQTKAAVRIASQIPRRWAISATPVQNHLDEYHTVFSVVKPDVLGTREQFMSKYCNTAQFPIMVRGRRRFVTSITGYRALDVFKQTIAPFVLQRTIEEVGAQMPQLTVLPPRWVELGPQQRQRYDEIEQGILQLDPAKPAALLEAIQRVTRLQQVVNLPSLVFPGETESAKLDEIRELLTTELQGRQVVIFSKQLEFLKQGVMPLLRDLGLTFAEIHGEMDNREAERHRSEFQAGQRDVAVITTAGEMGLNLDAAPYMICCDLLFNEARMRQVYARIRRASSVHPTAVVYRVLAQDTLEERVLDLLAQRGAMLDFLDSPDAYDQGSLNALMRLINRKISILE